MLRTGVHTSDFTPRRERDELVLGKIADGLAAAAREQRRGAGLGGVQFEVRLRARRVVDAHRRLGQRQKVLDAADLVRVAAAAVALGFFALIFLLSPVFGAAGPASLLRRGDCGRGCAFGGIPKSK